MTDYGKILKNKERAIYGLRALFGSYGYSEFKAGKFEDYELYAENKDFLTNEGILTFTDGSGRLKALKPDVTLSVAKDAEWEPGVTRKIYYDDEVYRMSSYSHDFREIMQTGIECMGDVDLYDECEVVLMAVRSLELISGDDFCRNEDDSRSARYVLDISHMGVVREVVGELGLPQQEVKRVLHCLGQKNAHGALAICDAAGVPIDASSKLLRLISAYGDMDEVLSEVRGLVSEEAAASLGSVRNVLRSEGLDQNVRFDFSVVNEMGYYNGIQFSGFVKGLAKPILAGGRYDNLMKSMGKKNCGAVGFSVSLDALDELGRQSQAAGVQKNDVDVLILYSENTDIKELTHDIDELRTGGKTVLAQRAVPAKLKYGELIDKRS